MEKLNNIRSTVYYVCVYISLKSGNYVADTYTITTSQDREDVRCAALEAISKAGNEIKINSLLVYKDSIEAIKINVYTEEEYSMLLAMGTYYDDEGLDDDM